MTLVERWMQTLRTRTVAFIAIIMAVAVTAISCSSGGTTATATPGISPELVADYIHTVLEADRTAYTRHVVNRATMLEGKEKAVSCPWRRQKPGSRVRAFPYPPKCSGWVPKLPTRKAISPTT